MASEPVNGGEGIDGAREKQIIKVYKRKGKGQRKQSPFFAIEKPEGNLENDNDNNDLNPPETLAPESVDPIVLVKDSVQEGANSQEDNAAGIAKNSTQARSDSLPGDEVIDKPLVEAFSHAQPQDDATDKNVPLGQDDVVNTIVGDKSVDAPSESHKAQDDVNTVVVDENSIKEPPKSLAQEEDGTTVIVDKNPIEVPSHSLSVEDVNTLVVDKNPIEVSSEEYVHVVDADNLIKEAHPENLVERDATDAQQPAGLTSDSAHATAAGSMPMEEDADGRIRIHVASTTKQQKEEIRKKLEDQLNVVRGMVKKIEDKEGEIGAYNDSRVLINTAINNGGGRILSGFASAGLPREVIRAPRPVNQLSISVLENTQGVHEHVEKEKRTPKANQFYRTSEFLLGDKLPPAESNKKSKSSAKKHGGDAGHGFSAGSKVFKHCSALLERLMKHKHGWVFNAPVDVKGLGLHDYFTIIEHPMDLGTIKSALTKNMYKSPREFADDVRLTFHNAMTYNPPGQDVHVMAETLLQIFEERWAVIEADYNREMRFVTGYEMNLPTHTMRSRLGPTMPPPPINVRNTIDRADWSNRQPTTTPGRTPTSATPSGRTPALKKPKANEPNKRDMTYEEKQKLSGHLQNLPPDKLDAIVQIVNKRNTAVKLRDEEIEVDIDSVDPETLWELDRFVTNYKKGLSKKKRKAELAIQARAEAERNSQQQMAPAPAAHEFSREGGNTAKKTLPTPLPSQVEKQNNETSRSSSSSSSSSGSSSSSDSDSDSSSSSGSDRT
ncbi:PREDICTED: transcription factor GTE4 [Camelina sativa]|uniref:Transcription factor GTE4 n=1 Tax=Camelina sativa TaxID=90675 RepID=A0ABM0VKW0_CAMSA|nr:PREDICTED: transcription factor GTE4 [Camelina sativa]XP_010457752.1 PREDICTED: transcription factor GTE4 [Camelina sativa]XP_019091617.1 PREDICTED: transcription factor GTE4 [Camelina sativa]